MKILEQTIFTRNERNLAFTIFEPHNKFVHNTAIIIAPAMAVLQRYYQSFAEYLCEKGYHVVTFDYLGIGKSKIPDLKDDSLLYEHWATFDLTKIIDWVFDNLSQNIYFIAHSAGGQLLGLTPSALKIAKAYIISSGIGYWRNWPFPRRYFYLILWYMLFPTFIKIYGYSPKWAMGEKVPKGVIKQWLFWGKKKNFMLDDKNLSKNYFTDITYDILFINFTDDTYAPYKNSLKLSSFYSTSNLVFKHIHPKEFNFNTIGHFGFFKKKYKDTLWSLLNL